MVVLTASDLKRTFALRTVLDGVSFAIDDAERVGLVGINGSGKSTLGRIVAGVDRPDSGLLTLRRDATLGYLEQVPHLDPDQSAKAIVLGGMQRWTEAMRRHEKASEQLTRGDGDLEAALAEQAAAAETLEHLGGWHMGHEADAVLGHLGISRPDAPVGTMSGGEQRRVALARLLVSRPSLAVLDEPTNHLDLETIEWLERYLNDTYRGALLLITHDRWLLDRVVDRTFELEQGQLYVYDGGYGDYLEAKAERVALAERTEANRQNFLRREIEWLRRQPKARSTKQKARIARAEGVIAQSGPQAQQVVSLQAETTRTGNVIVELANVTVGVAGRTLVRDLDLALRKGERVGVIGKNGTGKTTLLKTILGELPPLGGEVKLGKNTRIAYLDQTRSGLDESKTVFENVAVGRSRIELGDRTLDVRSWLEQFLFSSAAQQQQVSVLSGGERARVALAKMLSDPANLMVLDEPTNDLDVATLGAMEGLLTEYGGTCLVVTHDRTFLDRVATTIVAFEGDCVVSRYDGNYTTYLSLRERNRSASAAATEDSQKITKSKKEAAAAPRTKLSYAERLELEKIDGVIAKAEANVNELEAALAAPETYAQGPERAKAINDELSVARAALDELMARWEELESKREG